MRIEKISDRLKRAGIESHAFESRIIAEHAKKNTLSPSETEDMIKRRESREPLQYILGEWEFYGDVYKLNKDCLIPRPETEFLTEYIIKNAKPGAFVLDLCSGSGCVSISALKRRGDLRAALVDISRGALEISAENAKINGVAGRADFYLLDIFADFAQIIKIITPNAMIVSNPPYLTEFEVARLQSEKTELSHEPEAAFSGGADGLDFYRFIIKNFAGGAAAAVFECGINQSGKIAEMFGEIGFFCDTVRDYGKVERVVAGHKKTLQSVRF
ncbi:MAG: peptide chain release factor N(5)-glutamine methyltransferase [Oscillospiraceae bacterium]|nr:peptide chain release factor N(5)-glutamine methyltransferase [Oscillospiraceae bacterium]